MFAKMWLCQEEAAPERHGRKSPGADDPEQRLHTKAKGIEHQRDIDNAFNRLKPTSRTAS